MLTRLYDSLDSMLSEQRNAFERHWAEADLTELNRYVDAVLVKVSSSTGLGWHASTIRGMQADLIKASKALRDMLFVFPVDATYRVEREDLRSQASEYLDRASVKMELLKRRAIEDAKRLS
jgi:hypothetical protein